MNLQHFVIEKFRNHSSTSIDCSPGVNLFLGNNGEGKTNILEGISYFCLARSFYEISDSIVTKIGENGFTTKGKIISDSGVDYEVQITFNRELNQKSITVNKTKIDKASALIGWFPAVILSPDQSAITFGSPSDRRRFIDFVLSQANRKYLESLMEYRRILKQRNKILSDSQKFQNYDKNLMDPWNENLAATGSYIIRNRHKFIEDFHDIMAKAYTEISGSSEQPKIFYSSSVEYVKDSNGTIEESFKKALNNHSIEELHIGYTLVGPHRDDFIFRINDLDIKNFASQGQHKTFLVALKLAEFFYLKDRCNETPILLLDDVLSELDKNRCRKLIETTAGTGQVFITSTNEHALDESEILSAKLRKFFIKQGSIEHIEDAAKIN